MPAHKLPESYFSTSVCIPPLLQVRWYGTNVELQLNRMANGTVVISYLDPRSPCMISHPDHDKQPGAMTTVAGYWTENFPTMAVALGINSQSSNRQSSSSSNNNSIPSSCPSGGATTISSSCSGRLCELPCIAAFKCRRGMAEVEARRSESCYRVYPIAACTIEVVSDCQDSAQGGQPAVPTKAVGRWPVERAGQQGPSEFDGSMPPWVREALAALRHQQDNPALAASSVLGGGAGSSGNSASQPAAALDLPESGGGCHNSNGTGSSRDGPIITPNSTSTSSILGGNGSKCSAWRPSAYMHEGFEELLSRLVPSKEIDELVRKATDEVGLLVKGGRKQAGGSQVWSSPGVILGGSAAKKTHLRDRWVGFTVGRGLG